MILRVEVGMVSFGMFSSVLFEYILLWKRNGQREHVFTNSCGFFTPYSMQEKPHLRTCHPAVLEVETVAKTT